VPTYDYICPLCGNHETRQLPVAERDATQLCGAYPACNTPYLGLCRGILERQASAPSFVVTGYNAKNGYSK
jgi:hypothetical protein